MLVLNFGCSGFSSAKNSEFELAELSLPQRSYLE